MKLTLKYFASLADDLNCRQETLELKTPIADVSALKQILTARGAAWTSALQANSTRCAINQVLAESESIIKDGDEIAFFPPVTGG